MIHALRRFEDRTGVPLSVDDYNKLADDIRSNRYDSVSKRQTGTRTLVPVEVNGVRVVAVYNKELHIIATFLTEDMEVKDRGWR